MKLQQPLPRGYRQTVRAEASAATGLRILDAFERRFNSGWYDEVRLKDVARDAGVTVQTVIRRFGGKDGLLNAVMQPSRRMTFRRSTVATDRASIVRALIDDYEVMGDFINRLLAQEEKHPSLRPMADFGRGKHRAWVTELFSKELAGLSEAETRRRVDGLVVALDFYVWKLIRRDMKRPIEDLQALMLRLVDGVLNAPEGGKSR
jgi:AcrR family transcriptional regulator